MKKILIICIMIVISIVGSGCATWDGMKKDSREAKQTVEKDSKDAWNSTKAAVHKASE